MTTPLATRIAQEHQAAFPPGSAGSVRRQRAIEALTARGLPVTRDENWKYANLRPLDRIRFAPPAAGRGGAVTADALPSRIEHYARWVFVDGAFAPELSNSRHQPGVSVRALGDAAGNTGGHDADARFALLNEAFSTDGAAIAAAADADCPSCVELVFVATENAQSGSSYPRIEMTAAPGARLGVIERHVSLVSDANFVNTAADITVGAAAHVSHYRIQQAGAKATWIDTLAARVAQDGDYQVHLINLGASSARSTLRIALDGERARLGLHSVSVADGAQVHDAFALVEHAAPDTVSRQGFRGVAAGRSRVAFNSKVVVREGARGSDSHQSLRGLLAGKDAEIDVRPQLEIHTDDVRCAHGATAGKLDEAMLFYLLSRGIDRETAQVLLKWAFLEDIVSKIAVPELRRQIERSLAGQMNEAAALGELL